MPDIPELPNESQLKQAYEHDQDPFAYFDGVRVESIPDRVYRKAHTLDTHDADYTSGASFLVFHQHWLLGDDHEKQDKNLHAIKYLLELKKIFNLIDYKTWVRCIISWPAFDRAA